MALAVRSAQTGTVSATMVFLVVTMMLGLTFLVIKFFEYKDKFELHHVPGRTSDSKGRRTAGADLSVHLLRADGVARAAHGDRLRVLSVIL
jgi:hypothetical protein